jgi:uncharacterized protein YodC (DUF2158 family)
MDTSALTARQYVWVTSGCLQAAQFKLEFKMLPFMKQVSIPLAVTLGVALSMSLSVPAFSETASVNTAKQSPASPPLREGDLVRVRSGGPLMTVTGVHGDQVNCTWTDWDGQLKSESIPIAMLGVPMTVPAEDPAALDQDERTTDQYYQTHCPSGSVSMSGKFVCAY